MAPVCYNRIQVSNFTTLENEGKTTKYPHTKKGEKIHDICK